MTKPAIILKQSFIAFLLSGCGKKKQIKNTLKVLAIPKKTLHQYYYQINK